MTSLTPVTLQGHPVRLEPMRHDHAPALASAGLHPALWRLQPRPIESLADMQAYVAQALDDQALGANVEAKRLMLEHAFERLSVEKVVFKTEALNTASRKAILALGAVEEGTFRRHLIADDGRRRDMVYFAMFAEDWPGVHERLRARLARAA